MALKVSAICLLMETDGCQSILSSLNTFGPERVSMALALSEGQIGQFQTLREQYNCVSVHMGKKKTAKCKQEIEILSWV